MFAGHLGMGLLLKPAERRLSLGALFFSALLLDLLLWIFVMLGIESVVVPPGYSTRHYLTFVFPYSHGFAAAIGWSAAAALVVRLAAGPSAARGRAALIVAFAVMSHFGLDAVVHVPDLPLLGNASPLIGLGLYEHMRLALGLELGIAAAGAWSYLKTAGPEPIRRAVLVAAVALACAVTVAGGTVAPPPPTARAAALPGIGAILLVTAIGWWVDRGPDADGERRAGARAAA